MLCNIESPGSVVAEEGFPEGSSDLKDRKKLTRQTVVGKDVPGRESMCKFQEAK